VALPKSSAAGEREALSRELALRSSSFASASDCFLRPARSEKTPIVLSCSPAFRSQIDVMVAKLGLVGDLVYSWCDVPLKVNCVGRLADRRTVDTKIFSECFSREAASAEVQSRDIFRGCFAPLSLGVSFLRGHRH
jgi:hypothetical protein